MNGDVVTPGAAPVDAPAPFSELSARRLGPVRRYFVRHPVAMDVVVMVIFFLPTFLVVVLAGPKPADAPPTWAFLGLLVAGTTALVWRRRAPLLTTAVMMLLFAATVVLTGQTLGFELGLAFAMYAVATSRPTWLSWAVLVGILAWALVVTVLSPLDVVEVDRTEGQDVTLDEGTSTLIGLALLVLIALAIGISVRNRRLHIAELVERANALARDRDQEARLVRASERSLIAREMHDVVAHSLSVMIALADGAGVALDRAPDKARLALDELSATGRTALADMRRVLGVLDSGGVPLEPQPGHPDLEALIEGFRTAGLTVRTRGLDVPLPGETTVQLAVFRIVQESLTNALRHAPGCVVDLALTATAGVVTIEVVSHGGRPVAESPGTGRGLIGMRERAGVYGGTVDAGPWRDGWRVLATLPWRKDAR